jgi:hypothetical protein
MLKNLGTKIRETKDLRARELASASVTASTMIADLNFRDKVRCHKRPEEILETTVTPAGSPQVLG